MIRALLVTVLVLALPAGAQATTIAVIGDTPYGAQQVASFPGDVEAINADPAVERVIHLGDIKSGSTVCSDAYFAFIKSQFDAFDDPLVYTPGDNEWTDCHRPNNGGYDPLERLAKLREVFFAGTQENAIWFEGGAQFGTVHVVGSNNGLAPWTGNTAPTPAQLAEVDERTTAALRAIDRIFARAHANRAAGVVVGMQADMWDGGVVASGFVPIIKRLEQRAHEFRKPVLLLEGDSHSWIVDHPIAKAPNLTRVVVQGSTNCPHTYLRLHVDPASTAVFSGENVTLPLDPACDAAPPLGGF
ncbi:MAG TPA: hypothetical protein VFZ89_18290 [Solirubrobacteraceae bacterium]